MKNNLFTAVICTLFLVCNSCSTPECSETYFLVDVTNPEHAFFPDSEVIAPYLSLTMDPYSGSSVVLQNIADVVYTMKRNLRIEPSSPFKIGRLKRAKRMKVFWEELNQTCEALRNVPYGHDKSSIYVAVTHALEDLTRSSANRKRLVLISDLHENTSYFSVFNEADWELVCRDPSGWNSYMNDYMPLPESLSGIVIEIRHTPLNPEESDRFLILSTRWKQMLESHGAVVVVSGLW